LQAGGDTRRIKNFLALSKSLRFRGLEKLDISGIEQLDAVGIRYAAKFFKFSTPNRIDSVSLDSNKGSLDTLLNGLCLMLPRVTLKVVLSGFRLTHEQLGKVSLIPNKYNISPD